MYFAPFSVSLAPCDTGHPPCRQISGLGSKDRPRASSPPHPPRGSHLCRQFAKWQIELYSKGCSHVRRGRMERGLHGDPHGGRAGAGGHWAALRVCGDQRDEDTRLTRPLPDRRPWAERVSQAREPGKEDI